MKYSGLALALASTTVAQNMTGMNLTQALGSLPNTSVLAGLLGGVQLPQLMNVTLFAPNDAAIQALLNTSLGMMASSNPELLSAVLSYHIVQGNYSMPNGTNFLPTQLTTTPYTYLENGQVVEVVGNNDSVTLYSGLLQNATVLNSTSFDQGTIHLIDRVLTIPPNVSTTAVALNLTSAVGAVTALNLTQLVDTTPNLTIFLPNNAAFQRIGGNLANLSMTELTQILAYHVVNGSVAYSTTLMNGSMVPTYNGANLTITMEGSDVYVNNAKVIRPDVLVANGVVHVIDRVLNPSNTTAAPNTATTEEAFSGATSASDEPFTSGVPTPTSAIATDAISSAMASATSTGGAFRPIETGALGMAALFGAGAAVMNL